MKQFPLRCICGDGFFSEGALRKHRHLTADVACTQKVTPPVELMRTVEASAIVGATVEVLGDMNGSEIDTVDFEEAMAAVGSAEERGEETWMEEGRGRVLESDGGEEGMVSVKQVGGMVGDNVGEERKGDMGGEGEMLAGEEVGGEGGQGDMVGGEKGEGEILEAEGGESEVAARGEGESEGEGSR